jgi:RNA polymerase sigma-70 factor (sigma-E family)
VGASVEPGTGDSAAFHAFFERHYAELARLAHLLTGEEDAADDLAADALVAIWRRWDRVSAAEHPAAYARGVVANLARSRIRSAMRERRRVALFWSQRPERVEEPDVPAVLDLREALQRLPFRKRACVVLRHAFDLSEKDTAAALGISVGTVKSQTSRGVAELERLLSPPAEGDAAPRGRPDVRRAVTAAAAPRAGAVPAPPPGPDGPARPDEVPAALAPAWSQAPPPPAGAPPEPGPAALPAEAAGRGRAAEERHAAPDGSAPAEAAADTGTRILGAASAAARPRTRTGRGV